MRGIAIAIAVTRGMMDYAIAAIELSEQLSIHGQTTWTHGKTQLAFMKLCSIAIAAFSVVAPMAGQDGGTRGTCLMFRSHELFSMCERNEVISSLALTLLNLRGMLTWACR